MRHAERLGLKDKGKTEAWYIVRADAGAGGLSAARLPGLTPRAIPRGHRERRYLRWRDEESRDHAPAKPISCRRAVCTVWTAAIWPLKSSRTPTPVSAGIGPASSKPASFPRRRRQHIRNSPSSARITKTGRRSKPIRHDSMKAPNRAHLLLRLPVLRPGTLALSGKHSPSGRGCRVSTPDAD